MCLAYRNLVSTPQLATRHKMCFIWSRLLHQYILKERMSLLHNLCIVWFALPSAGVCELCRQQGSPHWDWSPADAESHPFSCTVSSLKVMQGSCNREGVWTHISNPRAVPQAWEHLFRVVCDTVPAHCAHCAHHNALSSVPMISKHWASSSCKGRAFVCLDSKKLSVLRMD